MAGGDRTHAAVRAAQPEDAAAICRIYNPYVAGSTITFEQEAVGVEDMAARIVAVSAVYPWLVAEVDGEVAGYAYATRWRSRPAYDHTVETTVYLEPRMQGRGIGATLYLALLDALRGAGVHAALGCIALPNDASASLHEKCGFRKVAHHAEVGRKFDRWVDVGFWQILL